MGWLNNMFAAVGNFVKTEIAKLSGDVVVVESAIENAATVADGLVNGLKNFVASPTGKLVEGVIGNVPGIGPYVNDVLNFLPQILIDLGWVKAEFTKSPAQLVVDGITAAVNASNPDVKATNLATLNAHITAKIASLSQAPITIQTALSMAPTVHVLNGPNSTTLVTPNA